MASDDLLDDLASQMGSDFGFGYDDELGDPNVKPKPAQAPREAPEKRTSDTLVLHFPRQQQHLTRLVLQAEPAAPLDAKNPPPPFASFSAKAADSRVVEVTGDPKTANEVELPGLLPGARYVVRLISTNPSGTVAGRPSDVLMTAPAPPPAPVCVRAETNSATLEFSAMGQNLEELTLEVARGDDNTTAADAFATGKPLLVKIGKPQVATTANIVGLLRGKRYFARLRARNAAGEAEGLSSEPFVTLPDVPPVREDHSQRSDSQVCLKFEAVGSYVSRLEIEYMAAAKPNFDKAERKVVDDPTTATTCLLTGLAPGKTYHFRLRATNSAGTDVSEPISIDTVEYAPDLLDKSGWLQELPVFEGKKTLGRRLSIRKTKPKKYWYVLDGKLLTWYTDVKGEEVGFMHLGKIAEIGGDEYSGDTIMFSLKDKNEKTLQFLCESTDPNVTSNELCISWIKTLKAAWRPNVARPMSPADASSARQKPATTPTAAPSTPPASVTAAPPAAAEPTPAVAAADEFPAGGDEDEEFGF